MTARLFPDPAAAACRRTQGAIIAVGPATVFSPHQAGVGTLSMKRLRWSAIVGASHRKCFFAAGKGIYCLQAGLDTTGPRPINFRADIDDNASRECLRAAASIFDRNQAAHGQADEREVVQAQRLHEGLQIIGHIVDAVTVRRRPAGLTVTALIKRQHAIAISHRLGERVRTVHGP